MLGISTAWNIDKKNGANLIKEIKSLGLETIELSYLITSVLLSEILLFVEQGLIKVISVHNVCPFLNNGVFLFSDLDNNKRKESIRLAKNTIDLANKVSASCVVLHLGKVEIENPLPEFINLKKQNNENYEERKRIFVETREKNKFKYFNAVLQSIDELVEYGIKKNILLGIENRLYPHEIPNFEEIEIILDKFKNTNVFYWHDTGHAEMNEKLGFLSHKKLLEKYGKNIIGFHLHDFSNFVDHLAPGQGDFIFSILKKYINSNTIKILEIQQSSSDKIIKGIKILNSLGII